MDSHVPIEITALTKSKQTQLTLVRFLTGVNSEMFGEGGAVGECLLAESTSANNVDPNEKIIKLLRYIS